MGTDTPPDDVEKKPVIKNDAPGGGYDGHRRSRYRNNHNAYVKKEKFMGAHPDLQGFVFEAKQNRTDQVTNFTRVDERIRAHVGSKFDSAVLESIENMSLTLPAEPTAPKLDKDGKLSPIDNIKYSTEYKSWTTRKDEHRRTNEASILHLLWTM
eukprot:scaffold18188_cov20-Cyclotella_meneghiniana.AAC.1